MIKWFAYIVVLLIFAPYISYAGVKTCDFAPAFYKMRMELGRDTASIDTTTKNSKKPDQEEKKKVKEVAKAKRQPKPEKIEPGDNTDASKAKKSKRQRRPEGLVRPPEIPRRNGN